jgi:hypothetical protein
MMPDSASSSRMFHPEITKKSKEMKRDQPVEKILYEDAAKRKEKLKAKEKEIYQPKEQMINRES